MSVSHLALRTRKVFGNFEKRVPPHVNQERKTINNNLVLDSYVGSTFSTESHKEDPRKLRKVSQILNGERWEVSTLKVKTRLQLSCGSPAVGIVRQKILNTAIMFFHTNLSVVGMS